MKYYIFLILSRTAETQSRLKMTPAGKTCSSKFLGVWMILAIVVHYAEAQTEGSGVATTDEPDGKLNVNKYFYCF